MRAIKSRKTRLNCAFFNRAIDETIDRKSKPQEKRMVNGWATYINAVQTFRKEKSKSVFRANRAPFKMLSA